MPKLHHHGILIHGKSLNVRSAILMRLVWIGIFGAERGERKRGRDR